jgi:hypothetical protein
MLLYLIYWQAKCIISHLTTVNIITISIKMQNIFTNFVSNTCRHTAGEECLTSASHDSRPNFHYPKPFGRWEHMKVYKAFEKQEKQQNH